jgi:ATP-dependent RNA helicase RhlB
MTANVEKVPLLIGLVRGWEDPRVMVFVNTKREADRVWGYLQGNGINTAVLSGDVPQKKRLKLLKHFTDGDMPVLVGTDVAARGLHIPDVTHVVNYDLPEDPEDYVHRIGRTARAGAQGDAVSFVCETYAFCLPDIEAFIGAKVPVGHIESEMLAKIDPRSRLRPDREDREYRHEGRSRHGGHDDRGRGHGPRDSRDGPRRERHPERRHAETRPDTGPAREAAAPGNEVAGSGPEHPHPPRDGRRLEAELPALTTPVEAPHPVTSGDPGVPGTPSTADAPPKTRRRRRRRKPAGDAAGPQPETAVLLQPGGETES